METLGQTLRRLRQDQRMTQAVVSQKARIAQGTYSLYEADKVKPGMVILSKLADVFGVSVAVLDRSLLNVPGFNHDKKDVDTRFAKLTAIWNMLDDSERIELLGVADGLAIAHKRAAKAAAASAKNAPETTDSKPAPSPPSPPGPEVCK